MISRLSEFGQAKQIATQEGTAFEQADNLEKGQPKESTSPSIEDDAMQMSNFYAQCDEITANTKNVEEFIDVLDKLHKQALTSATTNESGDASVKIDLITAKINTYSNRNRTMLKNLDVENEQLKEIAPKGSGHMRMRLTKHNQLASSFLKTTKNLQRLQQAYREKYRQQLERQYKIVNPSATPEEMAQITNDIAGAQAKMFASAVREDAKKTLVQMKDRFQDVKLIEKSILELQQLFLDLQTMVVQQGDIINKVGYNVDKIDEYNENAAQDLKLAVDYQKSIWKKKWMIIILIIIGIVILILVLLYLLRPLFIWLANSSVRVV